MLFIDDREYAGDDDHGGDGDHHVNGHDYGYAHERCAHGRLAIFQ